MYHSFIEMDQSHVPYIYLYLLIWGGVQQCAYETKIRDIDDPRKRLMQTRFGFEQDVIDAATEQARNRVRAGVGHFEHML